MRGTDIHTHRQNNPTLKKNVSKKSKNVSKKTKHIKKSGPGGRGLESCLSETEQEDQGLPEQGGKVARLCLKTKTQ